jgi:hypothetical protein
MTSIEHFHSDFLDNDHYENLSLITNLTTDLFTSDTNELNWPILILSILAW